MNGSKKAGRDRTMDRFRVRKRGREEGRAGKMDKESEGAKAVEQICK